MTSLSALLLCLALAAPQTPDPRAEAERLANAGSHAEALRRFQAIAAANPDDVAARVWIGRLHMKMGQPNRAAAVFESIVSTAPQNVDALVGLGLALSEAGRFREAGEALGRAEALAANRIDLLDAQGRYHAAQGRPTLALAYYERALAAEPGNTAIRAAADVIRASMAHRVEGGYDVQSFSRGAGSMHAGTIGINVRVDDAIRVFAQGQAQRFEGGTEGRAGGGVEWMMQPDVRLRGGALFGADTEWLPGIDVFVDAELATRRTRWSVTVRYFDFEGADLWLGGPGFAFDVTPRVTVEARYLLGRTAFDTTGSTSRSGNGMIGLRARLTPRARAAVGYHRGIDRLDWMTADRLTATSANTLSGEGAFDATPFVTVSGRYDLQERSANFRVHRGRVWLTVGF